MPTSITVAPGLIQSPRTISGRPTAANTRSARRHTAGRSRVLRMRDRHGRVLGEQELRQRLADDVGAADHDRLDARRASGCTVLASMMQPSGVQGTSAGRPVASRPALIGWKPSTSLAGSIASMTFCASICARQRQLHQDAVDRRIGVELPTSASSSASLGGVRQAMIERAHAGFDRHALVLLRDIDCARRIVADQHDREARHRR